MLSKVATTPRGNNSTGVEPNIDQGHNSTMAKKPTLDEMRLALTRGKTKHEHAHEKARLNAIKMLGLHEKNTAQDRAKAMGINTDVYHGSKQDIQGGFSPGYDDELSFVTPHPEFANKWIGKGKFNERTGDQAKAERDVADALYKQIKYKNMDYESLDKLKGDEFHNEYDRRNALSKADLAKEFGTQGHPMGLHNTVYPLKIKAHKTFNPETDMHVMEEFFRNNGIPQSNIDLYKTGNYMMYETKPVVNYLKSKGYDSMRLRESTDDNYPTIAVFDPKHVRSRFAAFDPAREHENDLLAAKGGEVMPHHQREANKAKFLEPSKIKNRLYHGTTKDIKQFKPSRIGALGPGTYLSEHPSEASGYAGIKREGDNHPNVMPLHVQATNPFVISHVNKSHDELFKHFDPEGKLSDDEVIKRVIASGHDSIYAKDSGEINMLDPRKIKSAIGNRGTYDVNEPDITKAKGGQVTHAHHLEIEERPL